MQLDEFLVITRHKEFGNIGFMGPMTGAELERIGENFSETLEVFGVPLSDVLALAGDHEDSGPMRMMQPMTVDQVALGIMAALFANENPMTEIECVEQAWNAAEQFMTEAMRRDAMGVPLQSDEPDQGESDNGEDKEKETGEGADENAEGDDSGGSGSERCRR